MPDDDILVRMHNIIREHLPCEVWMLNFCHQALCTRGVLGQLPVNVLIASFSIYARNLIDLFYEDRSIGKGHSAASHYIQGWVPIKDQGNIRTQPFYGKLNNQTAHLTYGRETDPAKKLGGDDISLATRLIDAEVIRFVDSLPEHWRKVWNEEAGDGAVPLT